MAKFYGKVGYIDSVESRPGIWTPTTIEREYYGDFTRYSSKFVTDGDLNDDPDISTEISIVADPFAISKSNKIRYVEYGGAKWKVTSVDPTKYPRLILSIGGVWNG